MAARVLVVLLAESRTSELTFDLFRSNVLEPLSADLALCVGDNKREMRNPYYDAAKYVWIAHEHDDWAVAYDEQSAGSGWRELFALKGSWFGGIRHPTLQQAGSGALLIYFREFLRVNLEHANLVSEYDWIIITRSDFMWTIPYPSIDLFSSDHVYVPDGEWYGGYTDRHIMIPRQLFARVMEGTKEVFHAPTKLMERMRKKGLAEWNTEQFIWFQFNTLGLRSRVRFFPYFMFTIREEGGHTTFSRGEYDVQYRGYIKYSKELSSTKTVQAIVRRREDWRWLMGWRRFVSWQWYLYSFLRAYYHDAHPAPRTFSHFGRRCLRFIHFVFNIAPFFVLREWPGALVRKPRLLPLYVALNWLPPRPKRVSRKRLTPK
jgi:hypothetical protein